MSEAETESPLERVPCPDDMCVGILGPDGKCGTCGRQGEPGVGGGAAATSTEAYDDDDGPDEADDDQAADEGEDEAPDAFDPDERVLCPDDMCTGVLSADGTCGTCGRRAAP